MKLAEVELPDEWNRLPILAYPVNPDYRTQLCTNCGTRTSHRAARCNGMVAWICVICQGHPHCFEDKDVWYNRYRSMPVSRRVNRPLGVKLCQSQLNRAWTAKSTRRQPTNAVSTAGSLHRFSRQRKNRPSGGRDTLFSRLERRWYLNAISVWPWRLFRASFNEINIQNYRSGNTWGGF